tara:strand:- start:1118 stop:1906 length:789 start_codon:yes stop_codon:yes gene_type:complete
MRNNPIGIFDSGVGGTSIWKEIIQLLPNENTIYLADIKHAPYGERTPLGIQELSIKNAERLLKMNCKIIVVACNTATTNAITQLRSKFTVPIIGIEPAIKPAALSSKNKAVGILATKGTLSSALFAETSSLYAQDIEVIEVIGTGIVELIESGKLYSVEMRQLLIKCLEPMVDKNIDYLVLGCSHYPYLVPILKELLPESVSIIDSGKAVARQTKSVLSKKEMLADINQNPSHKLYSNSHINVLEFLTQDISTNKTVEYLNF